MTRCRHSWRGLDTITAITRDVGDPFQYMHNAQAHKHQVFRCKTVEIVFEIIHFYRLMAKSLQTGILLKMNMDVDCFFPGKRWKVSFKREIAGW